MKAYARAKRVCDRAFSKEQLNVPAYGNIARGQKNNVSLGKSGATLTEKVNLCYKLSGNSDVKSAPENTYLAKGLKSR